MVCGVPSRVLHGATLALLVLVTTLARGADPTDYRVDLSRANAQLVTITMTVPAWDRPEMDVHLPVWRPGRYGLLDLAAGVRTLNATDASGAELPVEKFEKASWRISAIPAGDVRVTYEIYANSLGERTRHADATHAYLSGSAVFLYLHERRAEPAAVRIDLPGGWRIASGLETRDGALWAPNYDVLVDSPIEVGLHEHAARSVRGVEFEVAVWGETAWTQRPSGINMARLLDDIEKMAHEQIELFGSFPASRYVFFIHVAPGIGGGTEHLNSTVCQARPETFDDEKTYTRFLGLLHHELFHTWNVKAFRPADLVPYEYQREDYTRHLWLAEGVTSYYDGLLPVRAGQVKPKAYLEHLGTTLRDEMERPGGKVQSLEDSSFDAWIKFFGRPSPDLPNSTVSFYSRGEVIALALDLAIRRATSDARSLDDVMRTLYARFPDASRGYTVQDVLDAMRDAAGADMTAFYDAHVRGRELPDYAPLLAHVGLELHRKRADTDPARVAYTGLRLRDEGAFALVTGVMQDGPAHAAGLIADDLVLALDGRRLKAADLDTRLRSLAEGTPVRLSIMRRDRLMDIDFTPEWREGGTLEVRPMKDRTDAQRAAYQAWLGIEPDAEPAARPNENADAPDAESPAAGS
ncbi:MAG: PDZ domain-containing protein [Planctomycetota bacterium]|nr:PDZ domain-containing protein [Planctomycetota bacterium]